MNTKLFQQMPLMGILRGIKMPAIKNLTEIIIDSGMNTVEITMNTPDAPALIKEMHNASKGKLNIGAGTVLSMDDLKKAVESGASFIVLPCFIPEIIQYCKKNKIQVFPGALTPHEIHNAWSHGATMVKVFPASLFGPRYFKELLGPFNKIRLMAVGGVRKDNINEYFNCGAKAVAVGASIFNLEQIDAGNFNAIKERLSELVEQIKQVRSSK